MLIENWQALAASARSPKAFPCSAAKLDRMSRGCIAAGYLILLSVEYRPEMTTGGPDTDYHTR